jgi:hypothetical protein
MEESDALKFFKEYNVVFKRNEFGLHEVKSGNIVIPNIVLNEEQNQDRRPEVITTELKINDMVGTSTLIYFAEILDARIYEAKKFKNI